MFVLNNKYLEKSCFLAPEKQNTQAQKSDIDEGDFFLTDLLFWPIWSTIRNVVCRRRKPSSGGQTEILVGREIWFLLYAVYKPFPLQLHTVLL